AFLHSYEISQARDPAMNYCVKCLCKNSCRTGAAFRAKRPSPCPSPVRYVYSEVFDLKPTSELAQSWLKNPAHLSQIGFVLMVSAIVGMARCAVPARVVAGGTNIGATLAIERVAPLHAARTSQRDVPTTLNRCPVRREREHPDLSLADSIAVGNADRLRTILPLPSNGRGRG